MKSIDNIEKEVTYYLQNFKVGLLWFTGYFNKRA